MKDMLVELFDRQAELLPLLGVSTAQPEDSFSESFLKAILGLTSEVGEVADLLLIDSKPWKNKPFSLVKTLAKRELVDVFFFLLEAFILLGITPEMVFQSYKEKQTLLRTRIQKGKQEDETS